METNENDDFDMMLLRKQEEYFEAKRLNPNFNCIGISTKNKRPSLFSKSRQQSNEAPPNAKRIDIEKPTTSGGANEKAVMGEIHEKILGNIDENVHNQTKFDKILVKDIVERKTIAPKEGDALKNYIEEPLPGSLSFPVVGKAPERLLQRKPKKGSTIFALSLQETSENNAHCNPITHVTFGETNREHAPAEIVDVDLCTNESDLNEIFGNTSVVVEDAKTAAEVHHENLLLLQTLNESVIQEERKKLFENLDAAVIEFLSKKRKEKSLFAQQEMEKQQASTLPIDPDVSVDMENQTDDAGKKENVNERSDNVAVDDVEMQEVSSKSSNPSDAEMRDPLSDLSRGNVAAEILQNPESANWINFNVIEKEKLAWMSEIPLHGNQLKPGEKHEARFDWKGVLLPYSMLGATSDAGTSAAAGATSSTFERDLYLHGEEPHRPGYTLQELFRFARSSVIQQRLSAYNAIYGILNIYQQGFYDTVLELPISKIFFLLRFGLDDNCPAMLEIVSKALAMLFYNETDEALLDLSFDNPNSFWQPILGIQKSGTVLDEKSTIDKLQRQLELLHVDAESSAFRTPVEDDKEEKNNSLTDFHLAEIDLVDCLLRTNIFQRIVFILEAIRPNNSTVSSCLKILIRIARAGKEQAKQIVNCTKLMDCLVENFLPSLDRVDTTLRMPPFYCYPQHLFLKLIRVLICQNIRFATIFMKMNLIEKMQIYIYCHMDIRNQLIQVHIESFRIIRCLMMLRMENSLYKKFVPAFRYILDWHYNHSVYEEGVPDLIRQHASALLAAIASHNGSAELNKVLGDQLHDTCCKWFYQASRNGIKEFSQMTLLTTCLNAVTWHTRHDDTAKFQDFIDKYLRLVVATPDFTQLIKTLRSSSIILRDSYDRRSVHPPLPNAGSILLSKEGPQLIINQKYPVYFLSALMRHLKLLLDRKNESLLKILKEYLIIQPMVEFLRSLITDTNFYLSTNFYAKTEIRLMFQILSFPGIAENFTKSEILQISYNFLCCLTADHVPEIEEIFENFIFNVKFMDADKETLTTWRVNSLEMVYSYYILVPTTELTLSIAHSQPPVLSLDWPYFQLRNLLQNYINNDTTNVPDSTKEREILTMTFNLVGLLDKICPNLKIVTPTEKLMYFMVAFMGPNLVFLDENIQKILREHLLKFFAENRDYNFDFEARFHSCKCFFENVYLIFIDHYQSDSFGNDLMGSLLLLPCAQKYDSKWRKRLWSEYAVALRYFHCDPSLLMNGIQAYLEPPETDVSVLSSYAAAIRENIVVPTSIPYRIAKYHLDKSVERYKLQQKNK